MFWVTACSPSPAGPTTLNGVEVLGEGEIAVEYANAVESFPEPLPEGYEYLAELGPEWEPGDDGVMERGMGEVIVAFTWLCSWEDTYLSAFDADDEAGADEALGMIAKWKFLPNSTAYMNDPQNEWTQIVLAPAQAGDPSGVRGDLVGTCGGFTLVKSP